MQVLGEKCDGASAIHYDARAQSLTVKCIETLSLPTIVVKARGKARGWARMHWRRRTALALGELNARSLFDDGKRRLRTKEKPDAE